MHRARFSRIFKKYFDDESNSEFVIQKLKDAGASMMECTLTLVKNGEIPLPKADSIVANSKAWKASQDHVENLRDEFGDALENME
jgi:hypothetical protein